MTNSASQTLDTLQRNATLDWERRLSEALKAGADIEDLMNEDISVSAPRNRHQVVDHEAGASRRHLSEVAQTERMFARS